jgi:hypothetical protein
MHILGEPVRLLGQVHEAILDGARNRMQAHDLVQRWLVFSDSRNTVTDEILDQRRSRRFILDENVRAM